MKKKAQLFAALAILGGVGWYYTHHKDSFSPLAGKFAESAAAKPVQAANPRDDFVNRMAALKEGGRILFSAPDVAPDYIGFYGWLSDDEETGGACGVTFRSAEEIELVVLPHYQLPAAVFNRVTNRPPTVEGERCRWVSDGSWQQQKLILVTTMPLSKFTPKHGFDVLKGMRSEIARRVKEEQP